MTPSMILTILLHTHRITVFHIFKTHFYGVGQNWKPEKIKKGILSLS